MCSALRAVPTMTENTNSSDNQATTETKPVTVHGWATLSVTGSIVKPCEKDIEDISHTDQVNALQETVKQHGYNPEKFHIAIDYIEEKHSPQTTLTDTIQYTVFGWCEYALTTSLNVDVNTDINDIDTERMRNALRDVLRNNDIDPSDLIIEIDEIHEEI